MDEDIKSNRKGVKNILDIENSLELLNIFQTFYHTAGRLPLSNGLQFLMVMCQWGKIEST